MAEWITSGRIAVPRSWHDFAGATFIDGNYEWQVRTWDALGEPGPFCSSGFFSVGTPPPGPTITAPANGATISTASCTVTVSYPEWDSAEWEAIDGTGALIDSGTMGPAERTFTVTGLENGSSVTFRVRSEEAGLWSAWTEIANPVSYIAPPTPAVEVDDTSMAGAIRVRGRVGDPVGDQPSVSHLDVYRRVRTEGGNGVRLAKDLAPSQVFTDHIVASGVEYDYRVLAYGSNGTTAWSDWSGETAPIYITLDGGGASTTGERITLDGGPL